MPAQLGLFLIPAVFFVFWLICKALIGETMYIFILACGFMIQTINSENSIKRFSQEEMAVVENWTLNKKQINQTRKSTAHKLIQESWDNHLKID